MARTRLIPPDVAPIRTASTKFVMAALASLIALTGMGGYIASAWGNSPQGDANKAVADDGTGEDNGNVAWLIRVPLPIDGRTAERTIEAIRRAVARAATDGDNPMLVIDFHVPGSQSEYGRGSDFGSAYNLAKVLTGEETANVRTVAFVPQTVQGHAVLPILACDEIIMAAKAELGPADADEPFVDPPMLAAYEDIAERRGSVPGSVALGLADSSVEIVLAPTEAGNRFVTSEELSAIQQDEILLDQPEVVFPAGQPGRFSGAEGRKYGFVDYLADNVDDVSAALGISPRLLRGDPSLTEPWRAARIDITGPISSGTGQDVLVRLRRAVDQEGVNFVCMWLDTPGGNLDSSMAIADYLTSELDPFEVRTVAYIPREVLGDASLIAMACDEVVMHPESQLGGEGAAFLTPDDVEVAKAAMRFNASAKGRHWSLPVAMISTDIDVFEATREDDPRVQVFLSEEERLEQEDPAAWKMGDRVTVPGEVLGVRGQRAVELQLADATVADFENFKANYGLEDDPALVQPGWADTLIRALASPPVAGFLLLVGFLGLYIELKTPGLGIGGFLSATCFVLFFWSRFLGGTAGWLEILLFIAGITFLLIEIFVLPGFGIFGLGGGLMVIASIVLACQTFIVPRNEYQFLQFQHSLGILGVAGLGAILLMFSIGQWLRKHFTPTEEERQAVAEREVLVQLDALMGQTGRTATRLCPSGKARFGDQLIDVMADCEMVDVGIQVEVVLVQGNRVFVRPLDEPQ